MTGGSGEAGDRIRTGDIQLGKLTLYQLSYTRGWVVTVPGPRGTASGSATSITARRSRSPALAADAGETPAPQAGRPRSSEQRGAQKETPPSFGLGGVGDRRYLLSHLWALSSVP